MIKSFTVGVKHHINLGSYESMEVEAQVVVDCEDMNFGSLKEEAQKTLRTLLSDTFHGQKRPVWFEEIPTKKRWVGNRTENG